MDIKDYIAVSGQSGLFRLISQGKNILIAENLETGKRIPVHASSRVSSMEEIAIFTDTEDKPLKEVFFEMYTKEGGKPAGDPKKLTSEQVRSYFASVLPTYDRDKVYVSDMKKILSWYNILVEKTTIEWSLSAEEVANNEPVVEAEKPEE
jgi:hypothetical protein